MAQIFWGYLFIFFSISLNGIDLLPDCLGYFFIMKGAIFLSSTSKHFVAAKPWSIGLAIITLLELINNSFIGLYLGETIASLLGAALKFADLYLLYIIILGIKDLAASTLEQAQENAKPVFSAMAVDATTLDIQTVTELIESADAEENIRNASLFRRIATAMKLNAKTKIFLPLWKIMLVVQVASVVFSAFALDLSVDASAEVVASEVIPSTIFTVGSEVLIAISILLMFIFLFVMYQLNLTYEYFNKSR